MRRQGGGGRVRGRMLSYEGSNKKVIVFILVCVHARMKRRRSDGATSHARPLFVWTWMELPLDMRNVIRALLEPKERIALQQACTRMYKEDPGVIPPVHLAEWQRVLEEATN